jgi:MFS family permease
MTLALRLSARWATKGRGMNAIAAALRRRGVYYGWVMLLGASVAQVTSWGILYYAFAVFLTPMRRELGWSSAGVTGAYSLALLISGIAALPVGYWVDRHGPRLLMTAGSCAAVLLVLAWATVGSLAAFYLIWAGIGVAMATVLYEPAFVTVTTWFTRQRGRALTVLTFIGGFASVVYVPLAAWLVRTQGWRVALVTLAALLAVGTIPLHALLLRRRPHDMGLLPDGAPQKDHEGGHAALPVERSVPVGEALRSPAFWRLAIAFFLATLSATALTVHFIPYLIGRGYQPQVAAVAAGLIGVAALPGRAIFTPLGDVLPRRFVTASIFLAQAAGLAVLLLARSVAGVVVFVALFGAGFGAITPARAALLAEDFGPEYYGRINGILAMLLLGARSLAPVGAGLLYGWLGSYEPVFWALVAASAAASAVVLVRE